MHDSVYSDANPFGGALKPIRDARITGNAWIVGVFRMAKAAPNVFAIGDPVFWDDVARLCTSVIGDPEDVSGDPGNLRIGWALAPAEADGPTVDVRLNGWLVMPGPGKPVEGNHALAAMRPDRYRRHWPGPAPALERETAAVAGRHL